MSSRQWRRLWREQGRKALGWVAVVILAVFLALDGLVGEYLRLAEAIEMKETAVATAQAAKERLPSLEASYAAERTAAGAPSSD